MKISYDADVDILTIELSSTQIRESDEVEPGLIVDYGIDDRIVGLEILRASKAVQNLDTVELENLRPTVTAR
jgi:uncharacterized protein YuzE